MREGFSVTMTGAEIRAHLCAMSERMSAKARELDLDLAAARRAEEGGNPSLLRNSGDIEASRDDWVRAAAQHKTLMALVDPEEVFRLGVVDLQFLQLTNPLENAIVGRKW